MNPSETNTYEELKLRLEKLKAKQNPKNILKKLPCYGISWCLKKRKRNDDQPDDLEAEIKESDITAFMKKLRTKPPPEDMTDDLSDALNGPGFEFPNDKEAAKAVKHWSKRFKQWKPPEINLGASTSKPVVRLKTTSKPDEVEFEGRRCRKVENRNEIDALRRSGVVLIEKISPGVSDVRFYTDLLKQEEVGIKCQFVFPAGESLPSGKDLKEIVSGSSVKDIYAPMGIASRFVSGMKKKIAVDGRQDLLPEIRVRGRWRQHSGNEKKSALFSNKTQGL